MTVCIITQEYFLLTENTNSYLITNAIIYLTRDHSAWGKKLNFGRYHTCTLVHAERSEKDLFDVCVYSVVRAWGNIEIVLFFTIYKTQQEIKHTNWWSDDTHFTMFTYMPLCVHDLIPRAFKRIVQLFYICPLRNQATQTSKSEKL